MLVLQANKKKEEKVAKASKKKIEGKEINDPSGSQIPMQCFVDLKDFYDWIKLDDNFDKMVNT
jgi:hypothetical protein